MFYYAVKRGRKTGVFQSWKECYKQVKGYRGARFKKFPTQKEAEAFVGAQHGPQYSLASVVGDKLVDSKGTKRSREEAGVSMGRIKEEAARAQEQPEKKQKTASKKHRVVYTDGCCFANGKRGAVAGIGVYWGPGDPNNVSERVDGRQTNNMAEITAATRAIVQAKGMGLDHLEIRTDSQFMIDCVTKWMPGWKRKGWRKSDGGAVKNKEELQVLDAARQELDVTWVHVRGHTGHDGNEQADRLAKEGATKAYKNCP